LPRRFLRLVGAALLIAVFAGCYDFTDNTVPGPATPNLAYTQVLGNVPVVSGDDAGAIVDLPFTVALFPGGPPPGASFVNQLVVSTNGFVTTDLTDDGTDYSNSCPQASRPADKFNVYWDDLDTAVYTETRGFAPNRAFVIEWRGTILGQNDPLSFQMVFFEGTADVAYLYQSVDPTGGDSATIGAYHHEAGFGSEENDNYGCDTLGTLNNGLQIQLSPTGVAPAALVMPPQIGASGAQVSVAPTVAQAVEGGTPGQLTFTRTGDTSQNLTIAYGLGGTAINGLDYEAPGVVTFPAGQAAVTKSVVALEDEQAEDPETVVATDGFGTGYQPAGSAATVTISDAVPTPEPADVCADAAADRFTDVPASNVHHDDIDCAADLGLSQGGPGGRPADQFGPALEVTRGQMASFVARLLTAEGVTLPASPPNAFDDDDTSVHHVAIDQLAALGVIGGNGEEGSDYFPGEIITREEMASFLNGAYAAVAGNRLTSTTDAFTDDNGSAYEADINGLTEAGVIEGKGGGLYDPDGGVRRDQMASFFVRLSQLLTENAPTA
jgi:hypothetical protein